MNVLEMRGITKRFFGVPANDKVDLTVKRGEIHALLGENGAGKTTLMNILYGLYRADEGEVILNGKRVAFNAPDDAIKSGIGMVHQHFMLVDKMTVLQNIILGLKPAGYPFINKAAIASRILALSKKYGMQVDPHQRIEEMSVGAQQKVEILKALYRNANLLILDEPTAVLTPQETADFFKILRVLKEEGYSIILICHKLSEILEISDTVTVLRDGKKVAELMTKETGELELSQHMIGRKLDSAALERIKNQEEKCSIVLKDVCLCSKAGEELLCNINITLHCGEILGIAGVDGNGQGELAEIMAGIRKQSKGRLHYFGEEIGERSIRKRFETGISYIPSDRHKDGLVLGTSVMDNLFLREYYKRPYSRLTVFNFADVEEKSKTQVKDYRMKTAGIKTPVSLMSGGNQQKVILARELDAEPRLVIACQPTRGLDIGATEYIRGQLMRCRNRGGSVLLISTDLEEILAMSDRIAVMHEGKIMGILQNNDDLKPETLGLLMGGQTAAEVGLC